MINEFRSYRMFFKRTKCDKESVVYIANINYFILLI